MVFIIIYTYIMQALKIVVIVEIAINRGVLASQLERRRRGR